MPSEEEIRIKIEYLEENSKTFPPIVGYFPSRYDPYKNQVGEDVKLYKNLTRPKGYKVKVRPNGSDVEFVGTNYDGKAQCPQLSSYALAVFDKTTHVLKMLPIAANKIFSLEPKVGEVEELEDGTLSAQTRKEKAEAMKDLQIMYSTRKAAGGHKRREALHATEDDETRQDLDNRLKGIKMHGEAQEVAASSINEHNVPPYDLEAVEPSRAYPLEKIIYKGEWEYLLDVFNILQRGGEVTPEVYPSFICNRVHKLEIIEDENEKRKLAGIFSFINNLIKFKDKCSMDGVRSASHHKIPGILFQKFSSMFLDSESKLLSAEKMELLMGYVLVLTLYVDNFRTDLTDIAKDVGKSPLSLRAYCESLGCKLVREKERTLAILSVPLKFHEKGRRKRRKN